MVMKTISFLFLFFMPTNMLTTTKKKIKLFVQYEILMDLI